MSDYNPRQAIDTLQKNAAEMEKRANKLYELRVKYNAAKIARADKEQAARNKYFNHQLEIPIRVSEFNQWLKWETYKELAEEERLANEIKIEAEALHTLEQLCNVNKFVHKLALLENNL